MPKSKKALNDAILNYAKPQNSPLITSDQPSSSLAHFVNPEMPSGQQKKAPKSPVHLHQVFFDTEMTNRIERYLYEEKLKGNRLFKNKLFKIAIEAFLKNKGY